MRGCWRSASIGRSAQPRRRQRAPILKQPHLTAPYPQSPIQLSTPPLHKSAIAPCSTASAASRPRPRSRCSTSLSCHGTAAPASDSAMCACMWRSASGKCMSVRPSVCISAHSSPRERSSSACSRSSSGTSGLSSAARRRKERSVGAAHSGWDKAPSGSSCRCEQSARVTDSEAAASGKGACENLAAASTSALPPRSTKKRSCLSPSAPQPRRSRAGSSHWKPSVTQHGETDWNSPPNRCRSQIERRSRSCRDGSYCSAASSLSSWSRRWLLASRWSSAGRATRGAGFFERHRRLADGL
mmetsp:Transcript_25290/g.81159  ORF Transcript_25290/g.81159 Transcript_25290/m.81159 type:complete len:299 (-) Transcript_25290:220-1116(-)